MNENPPVFGDSSENNNQNQIPTPPPPPQVGNYYATGQGYNMAPPNDSGAVPALVFGILSVACCGLFGPVGLIMGMRSRQRIKDSYGTLGGEGMALAGFICGIIGCVSLAFTALWLIFALIGVLSSQ